MRAAPQARVTFPTVTSIARATAVADSAVAGTAGEGVGVVVNVLPGYQAARRASGWVLCWALLGWVSGWGWSR